MLTKQAIAEGSEAYPNGQREDENPSGTATKITMEPHSVVMMLGDNLGDLTEDFSTDELDANSRAELTQNYTDQIGTTWILLPNAMYGNNFTFAEKYGFRELLSDNSYTEK